jgi:hypothetical protein
MSDFYDTSSEVERLKSRYPAPPSKQQIAEQLSDRGGFSDLYDLEKESRALREQMQSTGGAIPPAQYPAIEAGARGAVQGVGGVAGLAAGLKLGAPLARNVPGALAAAGLGVAGMVMGAGAFDQAAEGLGLRSPEQMPPDQRPMAIFGQNTGAGIGMIMPIYGAAAMGAKFAEQAVGGYFKSILDTARRSPWLFGTVETSASASAGGGGALAETADPGNAKLRFGMEMAGGITNPLWRTNNIYQGVSNLARSTASKFSTASKQDAVAKQILTLMAEEGQDPVAVVRVLKQRMPAEYDAALTAGQKSGNDVLIGFEQALYDHSGKFSNEAKVKAQAAMDLLRVQVGLLATSGKPGAMAEIAKLRQARFETLITDRLEAAGTEAAMSVARISKGGAPVDMSILSNEATQIVQKVDLAVVDELVKAWGNVKRDPMIPLIDVLETENNLLLKSADQLKGEKIPPYLADAIKKARDSNKANISYDPNTFVITETDQPIIIRARDLIDFRRKIGSEERAARNNDNDLYKADNWKKMDQAILRDLDKVFKDMGDESYDIARALTAAHADAFERSFAGKVGVTTKRGDRLSPAELLTNAMATDRIAADINLRALEKASGFLETRGIGEPGVIQTMLDTQEQFYRIVTRNSLDKNGRIDPNRVHDYIKKNKVLLNREPFHEVEKDLLTAIKSEEGLRRLENMAKARNTDIGKDSAFARIVNTDPIDYASRILVSTRDQEARLISMFNMAKKGGKSVPVQEGISSARATMFAAAIERNMSGTTLDLDGFRASMLEPNVPGAKPVIQVMQEQGVVDAKHVQNIRAFFDVLDNVSKASRLGGSTQIQPGASDVATLLGAKVLASEGTTLLSKVTGRSNNGLIIPAAVARATEQFVSKLPQAKTKDIAVVMFNNPELLATVLERNMQNTPAAEVKKLRQLNAWFLYSGIITPSSDSIDREYERPAKPPTMMTLPP